MMCPHLKERKKIVKLLAGSTTIEKDTTSLEESRYKTNAEEVIWHVKRIDTTWDWWSTCVCKFGLFH